MDVVEAGQHLVVKVRLKHLLSDRRHVDRISSAVTTIHEIGTNGLVFGKLLYLDAMDREVDDNGGVFDAAVAGRMSKAFPVDAEQVEEWMDIVASDMEKRQGRPYGSLKALWSHM